MVTPMTASGEVNEEACADLARALIDSGTEGLVVTGTTGESPTLSDEEQVRVWRAVKAAVGSDVAVIAGATNNDTAHSIAMTQQAEQAGCDGVLMTVPAYNKPTPAGLVAHFTAIAESTSLPGLLYNVPGRTALNMTAATTNELSHVPGIVGVKEASADLQQICEIIDGAEPGFRVWSGNDGDTLSIMGLGGYGVVSVAAHLVGRQIREMISACLAGSNPRALEFHLATLPLTNALFIESNPGPVKFALNKIGFPAGDVRLPLVAPTESTMAIVRAELESAQIDLLVPARTV
jgi:4-hydroxy-tetrahydrodipicolinate synthase